MASKNIQWHPGFYAGMELDLRGNALEFEKEFQLTKGPLSIASGKGPFLFPTQVIVTSDTIAPPTNS